VGVNLYVVKNIAPDVPMSQVLLGVIPFGIIDLPVIVLMFIWPEWAIWLPNKMIG
jgi:TRAP-type mannitol/chloroaromatic compound transport system permease large subunit